MNALAVYSAALRRAAAGQGTNLDVLDPSGVALASVDASIWSGGLVAGDTALLARCCGPTLDVGCGAGRLVAALHRAGRAVLGIDVSTEAVRQAARRGVWVIRADVFEPLPGEGQWRTVLLADGNIGIGGDPPRLLRRCARLLGTGGTVLVELQAPGEPSWRGEVVLRDDARHSAPFPWAVVSTDGIGGLAELSGLRVRREWTEAGRWFAALVHG
jgi:SAM-dependent methyltransferase